MNTIRHLIPILTTTLISVQVQAQSLRGAWMVCTNDLQLRETLISHADEQELVLQSAFGIRSSVAIRDVLFMVRTDPVEGENDAEMMGVPSPNPSPVRLVTLSDGQVIRGTIIEPELPEELAFSLIAGRNIHGQARIPLERIMRIADTPREGASPAAELLDDTIVTRTRDVLMGFIESIGPMTRIVMGDGTELDIETSKIRSIRIANELESVPGVYLTMSDHEVLRANAFDFDNQQPITIDVDTASLGLEDTGNSAWVFDAGTLQSLRVISPGSRIVALTGLAPDLVEPTGTREWVPQPALLNDSAAHPTLGSIDLPTPRRVHYLLPSGATRFACTLEAPIEEWTDCVVRVIVQSDRGSSTLFEGRLSAEVSKAELNTPLPRGATHLIIEVDPGEHGPIQDRVLIHRPRLLVQQ